MNNIFIRKAIFFLLFALGCSCGYADIIYLKSGKQIEGKIKENTGEYIKIDFYGVELTYQLSEIEKINDDKIVSSKAAKNKELSLEIALPKKVKAIDHILKIISELRKLDFKKPVNYDVTSRAEIKKYLLRALEKQQKKVQAEEKMLKYLGLLPAYVDYNGLILELLPKEIAGYYSLEEKKLFIVEDIPEEKRNLAITHEACHALQDQYFDLNIFLEKDKEININSDRQLAHQSIVEGEASAIMLDYELQNKNIKFTSLPNFARYMDMFKESMKASYPTFDSVPNFLGETFVFPYLQGLNFFREIRLKYPWEWVGNLYSNPPNSTEQIMHPEKYLEKRDEPIEINLPELSKILNNSWSKVHEDTLGEFVIRSLLKQFSDLPTAFLVSEGWGGDRVILFEEIANKKTFLILLSSWDSREDAEEFFWGYQDVVKNKYLEEKPITSSEPNVRLWNSEKGDILLEIRGEDVLVIEGAPIEFREKIRNKIWEPLKRDMSFVEKEDFLNPSGLRAEKFYQKGKALCDKYRGDTILLYEALIYFKKAIELDEDFIEAYPKIAGVTVDLGYLEGDNYDAEAVKEAFSWIDKAKEINPLFPDSYRVTAKAYFALKKYDSAQEQIEKAISLDANNSDFYFWLGRIHKAKKEYDKAIEAFNKAVSLNPKYDGNYDLLGIIYFELRDYEKSLQMHKKAVELKSNSAWYWNNYSLPLIELGRYDEAIDVLKNALKIMDFGMAHRNLGRVYMGKKMYKEAEEEFKLINDTEMLSYLYREMKHPQKQIEMLDKTLRSQENAWAYVEKARILKKDGNLDEALLGYQKAIEINPQYALAYHDMGQIYEIKGDIDKVAELYERAVQIDEKLSMANYDLGRIYNVERHDPYRALTYLKKSVDLDPNYADTYYQLARAYEDMGDRKNSIINLEKYLELAPNGNEANSVRAYLKRIKKE